VKWFKHYSDASTSQKLNVLMDKYGLEGYARYWLLIELLAEKFDGKDPTFQLHLNTIKQRLRTYHTKIIERFLKDIGESLLMSVECDDKLYTIYCPKLLEIKDNHTRNLQVKTKSLAPRKEKKRKEKNISKKSNFDIDLIYAEYPKKVGKAAGIKKLHSAIKTQSDYDKVMCGVKQYKQFCLDENTDQKYIKQFSTWVNNECWNDEYISQEKSNSNAEAELIRQMDEIMDRGF
jgi:hypothetical protein